VREINFFAPHRLRVSCANIVELLTDFDYTQLPETTTVSYRNQQRKLIHVELSDLDHRSLVDHCEYYGKSFTTTIMQVLIFKGVWHEQTIN
jgi:hypothetical protein